MKSSNRRIFMLQVAAGGTALLAAQAHAQAMLEEKDAQAVALGYVHDTTKADKKKYPKHSNDQHCANCADGVAFRVVRGAHQRNMNCAMQQQVG